MDLVQSPLTSSVLLLVTTYVGPPFPEGCLEGLIDTAAQELIGKAAQKNILPDRWGPGGKRAMGSTKLLPLEISEDNLCQAYFLSSCPCIPSATPNPSPPTMQK